MELRDICCKKIKNRVPWTYVIIPNTSGLVKKIDYSSKITDIESKTTRITSLSTNSALTAVENKIPNVSGLVKKTRL